LKKKPAFPKTKKGTKGHKGNTLKFVSSPDKTITIPLQPICDCGCSLSNVAVHAHQSRQVFDMPEPKLEVVAMVNYISDYSIIKDFKNWAVHDCWSSYFAFKEAKHAVCGAHLLRELTALIEKSSFWVKHLLNSCYFFISGKKNNLCHLQNRESKPCSTTFAA